ncbi:MAG TPA: serine dehydrogenasease [Candidatus Angelobacter sp.]|nr:serine dehydrogenasease [Candidatus Angelobacter sp.]
MASPATGAPAASIPATANEFIEHELHSRLTAIESAFNADALAFNGPIYFAVDDIMRKVVEKKCQNQAHNKIVILITTEGGYLEPVRRMVEVLRRHYQGVEFIIPDSAYSAGTVFVMSGDAIHMDYYSRLGPIDPQIETAQGRMVSALGKLEKYEALIAKAQKGNITAAEVQLLIDGFDQAELYHYEQERDLSIALLEEWLVKYKFKNWSVTDTQKTPVTEQMKKDRASYIGSELNNTKRWHSHGYGISMDVLQKDLKLIVDDYGNDKALSENIRRYHDLLSDYMSKRGCRGVLHVPQDYRQYM